MSAIGQRLGLNVGTLVGHRPCGSNAMARSARTAMPRRPSSRRCAAWCANRRGGALGLSITRKNHFDIAGKRIPAACAPESELFALADVLRELGHRRDAVRRRDQSRAEDKLLSRIRSDGRAIMYNTCSRQARQPGRWKEICARRGYREAGHSRDPALQPGSITTGSR